MAIVTALSGMVVGSVVVSQSLYAMTNDHLPEYATLLAIGFSRWKLILVVVVQALALGIAGIVIGSYFFGRAAALSHPTPLPLELTPEIFGGVLGTLLACCGARLVVIGSFHISHQSRVCLSWVIPHMVAALACQNLTKSYGAWRTGRNGAVRSFAVVQRR